MTDLIQFFHSNGKKPNLFNSLSFVSLFQVGLVDDMLLLKIFLLFSFFITCTALCTQFTQQIVLSKINVFHQKMQATQHMKH